MIQTKVDDAILVGCLHNVASINVDMRVTTALAIYNFS